MTADAGMLAVGPRTHVHTPTRARRLAWAGGGVLAVMWLVALIGPALLPVSGGLPFEAPSWAHPLGTDDVGQDLLALLVAGGRSSLAVALAAALIATLLGATLGIVAGLAGGRVDTTIARALDVVLALPFLPLVIVVGAFLGRGMLGEAAVIGVAWSAHTGRILRSQVLEARSRTHVEMVRAMGAPLGWVARRHLLPIVTPLLVPQFVRAAGAALIAEASIAFLGLGDPTVASWGGTIAFGQARGALLTDAWVWWIVPPGACIALVVGALAMLGFGLEERLQPRIARWDTGGSPTERVEEAEPVEAIPSAAHPDPLLEVTGLRVGYTADGSPHVDTVSAVDLTLAPGETVGIVGESGSGKSTLVQALVGLGSAQVRGGTVRFEGRDLLRSPSRALRAIRGGRIGIVPQDAMQALDPVQPVAVQVAEVVRAHGRADAPEARRRAVAVLERVGIPPERTDAYPHELSGGMRQRVVIAMALVNDPVLLVADEPTTGLDVVVQVDLAELLSELRAERGMAMLVVSHDLPTLARLADRVLVMSKGRVVEAGDVRDVLGGPRHAATARLVATLPAMPAPVGHDGVRDAGRRSAMAAVTEAVGP